MGDLSNDIERYLSGKMSASEMHAFEKRAMEDPFLSDALEGAGSISPDQFKADVSDLSKKIASPKGGVRWLWPLRIAALLILTVGGYWMFLQFDEATAPKELSLDAPSPKVTTIDSNDTVDAKEPINDELASSSLREKEYQKQGKIKGDGGSQQNAAISSSKSGDQNTAKSQDSLMAMLPPAMEIAQEETGKNEKKAESEGAKDEARLEARKAIVTEQPVEQSTAGVSKLKSSRSIQLNTITGQVMSEEDGTPIPGVNVTIKNTNQGTVTDVNGQYQLSTPDTNPNLIFSYVGLQSKEVVANQQVVDIKMTADVSQLSEVVVTGYAAARDDSKEPVIKLAEPAGGRRAYDKYLQNSLQYPAQALENKIKGKVTIQFTVHTDGSLDSFNVLRGLGYGCDEEVIRLVKEGPKWSPTLEDNIPVESEVRVKVKFSLPSDK